jgi:hypothetical protein
MEKAAGKVPVDSDLIDVTWKKLQVEMEEVLSFLSHWSTDNE